MVMHQRCQKMQSETGCSGALSLRSGLSHCADCDKNSPALKFSLCSSQISFSRRNGIVGTVDEEENLKQRDDKDLLRANTIDWWQKQGKRERSDLSLVSSSST